MADQLEFFFYPDSALSLACMYRVWADPGIGAWNSCDIELLSLRSAIRIELKSVKISDDLGSVQIPKCYGTARHE